MNALLNAAPARRVLTATWLLLMAATGWAQDAAQPTLPRVELIAGMHRIVAEVAIQPVEQMTGLMFRKTMGPNEGMLFVYEVADKQCFWMHNTLLPLTAAFIDDSGRIVNLVDMQPRTDDSHCSVAPVRFVLEMNQGWFAARGLKPGFRLRGAPFKP